MAGALHRAVVALAIAAAFSSAGRVSAQSNPGAAPAAEPRTPSVVPRGEDLAPPRIEPSRPALPSRPGLTPELGKPEDDLRIDIARFAVDDTAPAELKAALPSLTARFAGQSRGFEDLLGAAAEVTRFLQRELGYYLGYAYVPEQTPGTTAGGSVIRIAVLEGRLDRVVLNWPAGLPVDREVVESHLSRLQPGSILRVRDVERVVFLVNDLRGITARFEVKAGSVPGTAQLVVTPRAESLWSAKVDADANGTRTMGLYRVGGLVQRNSPFGRGDGFTANVLSSTTGGLAFALLGYNTPVGGDGFKLGTSLSGVRYQLDKDEFPLGLNGQAVTANGYGLYPLVRSRNLNLFAVLSLEHKAYVDRQSEVGAESTKNVQTVVLGSTGDFRDAFAGGGVNTFDVNVASGRVRYPEGRPGGLDDAPGFTKVTAGVSRLQDVLTGRLLAYVAVRGQWTADNLDTTEQFRLGGPDGVRGFVQGEGTGDSGIVSSLELRLLPPEAWFGRVAREMVASVFYDVGRVRYRTEPRSDSQLPNADTFKAAGLGLAWVRPGDFALRLSVARPLAGTPRADTSGKETRVYLQFSGYFDAGESR